jgi:hypothetical protein
MENDGIEMSKMRLDDEEIASNGGIFRNKDDDHLPEPMEWVDSRIRTHNRCFALLIAGMVIAGAVYIMGGV